MIDTYWWETPQFGYRADVYNQRYDDIAGSFRKGGIERVQMWARDLAPHGYDAHRTSKFFQVLCNSCVACRSLVEAAELRVTNNG